MNFKSILCNRNIKYKPLFILLLVWLYANLCLAQGIVNVNTLTGTASATIPIYTVTSGQVSVPISVTYSATGVKPKDVESTAGMGWQLQAGGQITRLVKGLPDDITLDNAGNVRRGWMSTNNNYPTYISGFNIQNDNNNTTCTDETTDINYLNNYFSVGNAFSDSADGEPDLFYVNAPGLSCELVYDKSTSQFRPVTYQDLKISYGLNNNYIYTFTITNDQGITYTFGICNTVTETAVGGSQIYFKTKFNQYQHGITYSDIWYLTQISDANGNNVNLTYNQAQSRAGSDPVSLYISGSTTTQLQYKMVNNTTPYTLASRPLKSQ